MIGSIGQGGLFGSELPSLLGRNTMRMQAMDAAATKVGLGLVGGYPT